MQKIILLLFIFIPVFVFAAPGFAPARPGPKASDAEIKQWCELHDPLTSGKRESCYEILEEIKEKDVECRDILIKKGPNDSYGNPDSLYLECKRGLEKLQKQNTDCRGQTATLLNQCINEVQTINHPPPLQGPAPKPSKPETTQPKQEQAPQPKPEDICRQEFNKKHPNIQSELETCSVPYNNFQPENCSRRLDEIRNFCNAQRDVEKCFKAQFEEYGSEYLNLYTFFNACERKNREKKNAEYKKAEACVRVKRSSYKKEFDACLTKSTSDSAQSVNTSSKILSPRKLGNLPC